LTTTQENANSVGSRISARAKFQRTFSLNKTQDYGYHLEYKYVDPEDYY